MKITRRDFGKLAGAGALGALPLAKGVEATSANYPMGKESSKFNDLELPEETKAKLVSWDDEMRRREQFIGQRLATSPPAGKSYEESVPDTLDLADCGALALHSMTQMLLPPEYGYGLYLGAVYGANPPFLMAGYYPVEYLGDYLDVPKITEALPEMRLMSGSREGLEQERGLMLRLLATSWDDGRITGPPLGEWRCHEGLIPRFLLGTLYWHQYDGNSLWLEHAHKIYHTIQKIIWNQFPPQQIDQIMYGWYILGLTRYAAITETPEALELAGRLAEMLRRPQSWQPRSDPPGVVGEEVGHSVLNRETHGYLFALRGLLAYAHAANDSETKRFVRSSYDYWRTFGIPEIGFIVGRPAAYSVTETCAIADMLILAVKLSDYGVGDYWEDVDQYVRNQLVENLISDKEQLAACAAASFPHQAKPPNQDSERAIERSLGNFANVPFVTDYPDPWTGPCCNHNGAQALYQAWEGIVRDAGNGVAQVNLLLNRSSRQIDVDSYLPYEGRVVLKNKTATRLHLRIPAWVSKKDVKCRIDSRTLENRWLNNYLLVETVKPGEQVTIEFPVVERTFNRTDGSTGNKYAIRVRGNTVMNIGPRPELDPAKVRDGRLIVNAPARLTVKEIRERDVRVSVTAQCVEDAGIVLRYAGPGDYVLAHYLTHYSMPTLTSADIAIYEMVNGTFRLIQKKAVGKVVSRDALGQTIADEQTRIVAIDTHRPEIRLTAEAKGAEINFTVGAGEKNFTVHGTLESNLAAGSVGLYAICGVQDATDCHLRRPFQSFDDFSAVSLNGQKIFNDGFDGSQGGVAPQWEVASLPINYRFYLRDYLSKDKAPIVRKTRFVSERIIRP